MLRIRRGQGRVHILDRLTHQLIISELTHLDLVVIDKRSIELFLQAFLRSAWLQVFHVDVVKVVPVTDFFRDGRILAPRTQTKRGLLTLYVEHDLVDLVHARAQSLIVLPMLEELVNHTLPEDLPLEHEGVAVLLDLGIVEGGFDHVAVEFEGAPHTLHLQRVVERELLMDEAERMVRPIVVVAILG